MSFALPLLLAGLPLIVFGTIGYADVLSRLMSGEGSAASARGTTSGARLASQAS